MTSFSSLEPPSPPQLACEGSIGPYHHPPVTFGASTELKKNELLEKLLEINKILQGEKDIFSQHLSEDFLRLESKLSNLTLFYNFISSTRLPVVAPVELGYFCVLPEELALHIFSFLEPNQLCICASVCKQWERWSSEDRLYKEICIRRKYNLLMDKPPLKSWKWLCKCNVIELFRFREGEGKFEFKEEKGVYVGDWKSNHRHGYGCYIWFVSHLFVHHRSDGSKYEGDWEEDKRQGFGTMTWADGQMYKGQWLDSRKEGLGEEVWPDGRRYVGEYRNSHMHGFGTYSWPGGDSYVGQWQEDNIHGHGTYRWGNGSEYSGQWAFDEHNGFGKYLGPEGEAYEGQWLRNLRHGCGTETSPSGHRYAGVWKLNSKDGKGTFSWPDGDFFLGHWKEGKKVGEGLLISQHQLFYQQWDEFHEEIEKGKGMFLGMVEELVQDSSALPDRDIDEVLTSLRSLISKSSHPRDYSASPPKKKVKREDS